MFGDFVIDLSKFMNSRRLERGRRTVLLIDNASIHKSKNTKEILRKTFNQVIFLPAYSPPFATVEHYFSVVKSNIIYKHKGIRVSMKDENGVKILRKTMLMIDQESIVRMWTHWLQKMKTLIHHFTNHTD